MQYLYSSTIIICGENNLSFLPSYFYFHRVSLSVLDFIPLCRIADAFEVVV